MSPSDSAVTVARGGSEKCLSSSTGLAALRLQPPDEAASLSQEAHVPDRIFAGNGRPSRDESERRRQHFVALVAGGAPFDEAAEQARIKPERALAILSQPEMRQLIAAA